MFRSKDAFASLLLAAFMESLQVCDLICPVLLGGGVDAPSLCEPSWSSPGFRLTRRDLSRLSASLIALFSSL